MTDLPDRLSEAARFGEPPLPGDVAGALAARRRTRRRRSVALVSPAVAVVAVLAVAVGPRLVPDSAPADGATVATTPDDGVRCEYRPTGDRAVRPVERPPAVAGPSPATATVRLAQGDVQLALATDVPCTTRSFVHLAASGFYDGTQCHRVTTQGIFVLQCGDPSGTGVGGPGYEFDDEPFQELPAATSPAVQGAVQYGAGTVAMANSGADTNGSQFFVVYADSELPPAYTVFARVSDGLDVLREIAAAGSRPAGDGAPVVDVRVERVLVP